MLDIRLLGSPVVTLDRASVEVDTRKAIALLAYLAVERAADRETLSALFWAESSPDRARATLRRTLSALRAGVGPDVFEADRNRITLSEVAVRCDIDDFHSLVSETADHGHDPADVCDLCIPLLSKAAELYRGDFLGAFSVRDSPDFEDWARSVTESMRLEAGEVFRRLAMAQAAGGDYSRAIATATRWIDLDELHEPAHRLVMLLNAWAGDRPGAIQAYRVCVAILDRELGVPPLEETTELFEAILDEDLPPAPGVRKPVRAYRVVPEVRTPRMIGRREASERLLELLGGIGTPPHVVLVTGESWMGKTTLLEYLDERAGELDVAHITGRAFRAESKLPYGVVTRLLDALTRARENILEKLPEWALGELARLDPKLAPGHVNHETGPLGQLRLREAYLALVETATGAGPLVVSIDDAQWADTASANVLAYIQRRSADLSLLLVLAARDQDSLPPTLREFDSIVPEIIALGPLAATELEPDFPGADVERIVDETGGIPRLVIEALDSDGVTPESASVVEYMSMRSSRLSDLSRQVLAAAAVLGGMCDAHLLRDTSGRTEDEIVEAVEELMASGLLREYPDGRLGFTLDVLESVTYESTSLIRRRLLHRRAGEALEARPRSRTDARLATATATQFRAAGSDEAASWYRLSGDLARAIYANDEAVMSYETAIALGDPDVGGIRLALGELAMARGDYETAMRELRASASQSTGSRLALVEHRMGDLHRILGRFELAEESFMRAEDDHPNLVELYADWALLQHRTGDPARAVILAEDAVAAVGEDDSENKARALNILGVVTPDPDEALAHIESALEVEGSTEAARMAALNNKAHLLSEAGESDAAIDLVSEAIVIAAKAGYRHHQAALLNHLADLNHRSGRREAADEALTQAVTIFAEIDAGDWEPEVWFLRQW